MWEQEERVTTVRLRDEVTVYKAGQWGEILCLVNERCQSSLSCVRVTPVAKES